MNIKKFIPVPSPVYEMRFSRDEGWALVAAIQLYADSHPDAADVNEWNAWARDLDKKLRSNHD